MQSIFQELPPIPILLLYIVILAWIAPLMTKRAAESLRSQDDRLSVLPINPKTVAAARRSFYLALFFTVSWAILLLIANTRHSESNRITSTLFLSAWILTSIGRYRKWRRWDGNAGVVNHPNIIPGPQK
jgi:hypothetical protein